MKKSKTRTVIVIVSIIAAYLLILTVGLLILIYSSMESQLPEYITNNVNANKEEGWETDFIENVGHIAGSVQCYDTEGKLLLDTYGVNTGSAPPDAMSIHYSCAKYTERVRSGKSMRRFDFISDSATGMLRVVYIYGTPALHNGKVIGEIFGVHSPLYFSRTLKVFVIFFTAAYIIAAASVLFVLGMRRRYEEARQKYIDNVTHALKTPVTSIKALAETLYDGAETDPAEQKTDLQLILQQADLQVDMVQNILSLSRIQTYGVKKIRINVTAEELIRDPVKKHIPQCEQKNITLDVADEIAALPELYTEPDAIRQVLDVLLDNAVKFTPADGKIDVFARESGKKVIFEVRDNGVGISKDILNKIFDRFYTTSIGNAEGNGLGLAIAKELIKGLKEKIWAESSPGLGTSVFFTVKKAK